MRPMDWSPCYSEACPRRDYWAMASSDGCAHAATVPHRQRRSCHRPASSPPMPNPATSPRHIPPSAICSIVRNHHHRNHIMEAIESLKETLARVRAEIGKVIIGQHGVIDHALMAILSRQHLLIEGVPGVGKTLLVRTMARVLGVPSGRIQFTPDLMPADITGT